MNKYYKNIDFSKIFSEECILGLKEIRLTEDVLLGFGFIKSEETKQLTYEIEDDFSIELSYSSGKPFLTLYSYVTKAFVLHASSPSLYNLLHVVELTSNQVLIEKFLSFVISYSCMPL